VKHVAIRTCLGCRQRRPKHELVRLVRDADGAVGTDARGRRPGRGAYVCADPSCVERALKGGRLAHAFRAACRSSDGLGARVLEAGRSMAAAGHDRAS
jgi:predicted RNA-binding protein YlxR (DUF448 family)